MSRRELVVAQAGDDEILFADGFDDCLLGYAEVFNNTVAVYDKPAVIAKLMVGGMTEEEALEHFHYNIVGSYVGARTPAFLTLVDEGER